ncbi:hypothetical protein HK102_003561 [Quaeritorhiza haematococci]|nr:hypothetical protein HK102_003561 [Quaeritorhiza haematococci]
MEGLSWGLVVLWTLGDAANYLGTVLTNQLSTQQYTGAYFLAMDVILIWQYLWYMHIRKPPSSTPQVAHEDLSGVISEQGARARRLSTSETQPLLQDREEIVVTTHDTDASGASGGSARAYGALGTSTTASKVTTALAVAIACVSVMSASADASAAHQGGVGAGLSQLLEPVVARARRCDEPPPVGQWGVILGSIFAWASGLLYFFSRIPQILENHHTKSVAGLSLLLFVLTIIGNLCYGVAILLRLPAFDAKFFQSILPYMIGSTGVLIFDFTILGQAIAYGGLEVRWPFARSSGGGSSSNVAASS